MQPNFTDSMAELARMVSKATSLKNDKSYTLISIGKAAQVT